MEKSNSASLGILNIERTFEASQEDVFNAFTQPEIMSQWFHPFPKGKSKVEADFRVGGKYRIEMQPETDIEPDEACSENEFVHYGEYLEIDEPNRLVFSWIKDDFVDYSIVSLTFEATGDNKTLLKLEHKVPAELIAPHNEGWTGCLQNLERHLA